MKEIILTREEVMETLKIGKSTFYKLIHDGILKGLFLPRDAHTVYDTETKKTLIYFMFNQDAVMLQAEIVLESESGKLKFVSEDIWDVKFSEKNDIMYMTVTDSDGKTVYYQQK